MYYEFHCIVEKDDEDNSIWDLLMVISHLNSLFYCVLPGRKTHKKSKVLPNLIRPPMLATHQKGFKLFSKERSMQNLLA